MDYEEPLIDKEYLLEKFPGKGGWTYARIPEIAPNGQNPFGWVTIRGSIDSYKLDHCKLMPMGDGSLFLPVKASIRKKIGKVAGDTVHVVLFPDDSPLSVPAEIIECFENEPKSVYENFVALTDGQKKAFVDWIYAAKQDETRANRILGMMARLRKGLGYYHASSDDE